TVRVAFSVRATSSIVIVPVVAKLLLLIQTWPPLPRQLDAVEGRAESSPKAPFTVNVMIVADAGAVANTAPTNSSVPSNPLRIISPSKPDQFPIDLSSLTRAAPRCDHAA